MCWPAIPTITLSIFSDEFSSASFTADWIDWIVWVILFTTPRWTPKLFDLPIPIIFNLPYSFKEPIKATILVVPISNPTNKFFVSIFIFFVL